MKKLLASFVFFALLAPGFACAYLIDFDDLQGYRKGQYITETLSGASLSPGSDSFMDAGQSLTFWSEHPGNTQHSYGWRYDQHAHFGVYIDFDAGKGGTYYAAGITFAIPVTDLALEYVKGNGYLVEILYGNSSKEIVALGNSNANGSSGWGNLYGIAEKGGITGITFFYEMHERNANNPQYLGLLSLDFNSLEPTKKIPTPLPATFWLMGMGMAGYAAYARRKKAGQK